MSLINETPRIADTLLYEGGEVVNFVRDAATLASGTIASPIGQVLGKITATGKYVQVAPAASDGSQTAAAVLLTPITATLGADTTVVVISRGPAVLKNTGVSFTSGMTNNQIAAATAQLQALGITIRGAYGV